MMDSVTSPSSPPDRGLLLGWDLPDYRQQMGIASAQAGMRGETPIWMRGEGHRLTIAPSGAGKTTGPVVADLLTHTGPALMFDPTGAVYAMTHAHRKRLGPVYRLDPCRLTVATGGRESDSLDPLDLVDPASETAVLDAEALAEAIIIDGISNDPHWAIRARQMVAGLILYVATHAPRPKRTLATVFDIVGAGIDGLAGVLVGMEMTDAHVGQCRRVSNMVQTMPDRERGSVLSTCGRDLGFLGSPQARRVTRDSTILVADLTAGVPMTIYIVIPPQHLAAMSRLLRAWLTVVITAASRRSVLPAKRTLIIVDEAAQVGGLDSIKTAVTLMRNYGLQIHLVYQDIHQLKSAFPTDWQTIANNCAATMTFGFRSQRIVDGAVEVTGYRGDRLLLGQSDDIAILCEPGRPARVVRRADARKDPCLRGLIGDNPRYARIRSVEACHE